MFLKPGVSRFTRSQSYQKRKLYAKKKTQTPAKVTSAPESKTVKVNGPKNGGQRKISLVKYYPADDVPVKKQTRKTHRPQKLKQGLVPGSVLILLSGRFAGKRVVFLKQLASGLLLVTGPHKINGVPLRRVNQAYVIVTKTTVDVSGVKLDAFTDEYFTKSKKSKKVTEEAMLDATAKPTIDAHRLADQKTVDASLLKAIKKVKHLKAYLNASFALGKGQFPHLMQF